MDKVIRFSRKVVCVFTGLQLILPILMVLRWFAFSLDNPLNSILQLFDTPILTPQGVVMRHDVVWTTHSMLLGLCADFLLLVPIFVGLTLLKKVFQSYALGEVFTPMNAKRYCQLGTISLLDGIVVKPLSHALLVLAVTVSNAPGDRYLSLLFGAPSLKSIFVGTLIIIISWVMLEASHLKAEHSLTI